ncbi:MAG: preprotein translocase subunit SecG [Candidatus Midichloriaceae bacterium]|jgi:preprotein translocase subunit SecG|nr:preprotein translocase subunit SecG [Candidatus Midichloriaceae bacterium]
MTTFLLAVQIVIVLSLIGIILLQKNGADSLAGLSGGGHNVLSGRSTTNILTKATIILAICFIFNSLIIAKLVNSSHKANKNLIESIAPESKDKRLEVLDVTE